MADTSAGTGRRHIKGGPLIEKNRVMPTSVALQIYAQTEPNFIFHINAEA